MHKSSKMNTKIEIKEEDMLSNVGSQNEREFFMEDFTMKTNSDSKTEIKLETSFPHNGFQKTFSYSKSYEIDTKTEIKDQILFSDFGLQNKREFLSDNPKMKFNKYKSDHEAESKVEIKEEHCWQETQYSSNTDNIKDLAFHSVKSPRLCKEAVSGDKSPLPFPEDLTKDANLYKALS